MDGRTDFAGRTAMHIDRVLAHDDMRASIEPAEPGMTQDSRGFAIGHVVDDGIRGQAEKAEENVFLLAAISAAPAEDIAIVIAEDHEEFVGMALLKTRIEEQCFKTSKCLVDCLDDVLPVTVEQFPACHLPADTFIAGPVDEVIRFAEQNFAKLRYRVEAFFGTGSKGIDASFFRKCKAIAQITELNICGMMFTETTAAKFQTRNKLHHFAPASMRIAYTIHYGI